MKVISFLEKLFFKKRVVFCTSNEPKKYLISNEYSLQIIEDSDSFEQYTELYSNSTFQNRLRGKNWILFLVIHNKSEAIAAYYWAVTGEDTGYWHDNFLVPPETALLCNAYVKNNYRQQGLYKFLIYKAHENLFQRNFKNVFTVVENSNPNSLKANSSVGLSVCFVNYLIKFLGFNVLSVFTKSSKIRLILFGSKLFKYAIYRRL
jgi:hypothetical protein